MVIHVVILDVYCMVIFMVINPLSRHLLWQMPQLQLDPDTASFNAACVGGDVSGARRSLGS